MSRFFQAEPEGGSLLGAPAVVADFLWLSLEA
jgi:hypothetical protein